MNKRERGTVSNALGKKSPYTVMDSIAGELGWQGEKESSFRPGGPPSVRERQSRLGLSFPHRSLDNVNSWGIGGVD